MNKSLLIFLFALTINLYAQTPIAVIDFEGFGISQSETMALTNRLRNELHNTGSFKVIERNMMEEILNEQGFQQTGCTSNECLVEIGRLVGVRKILGGSISIVGDVFSVSVRIVDVETGEVLEAIDYDFRGEIGNLLTFGMRNVALELAGVPIDQSQIDWGRIQEKPIWKVGLSTQFFVIPTYGRVVRNENEDIVGMKGFSLWLGYYKKNYCKPLKLNSWNHFWHWGTLYLIIPYIGIGTEYVKKNGVFYGISTFYYAPSITIGKYF